MNGLYIHIPFCKRKCNYCDFVSYPKLISKSDEYVTALCGEMELYKDENVNTVYLGGGTPSLLNTDNIKRIIDSVHTNFNVDAKSEITIEVNPCTIDGNKAKCLADMGFNRVSLGAQSFVDTELSTLGRLHSSNDTVSAYNHLRDAGFKNISLDLMYALPGQSHKSLEKSLEKILELSPEHISCYGLKIEEGTPFYKMLSKGELREKSDDEYADMYEIICKCMEENNYPQYELSNFSRPGFESKHNLKYWTLCDYIGLGVSASSCYKGKRYTRASDLEGYLETFENAEAYELSADDKMSEYMILSLRLVKRGAVKKDFENMFGRSIASVFGKACEKHIRSGLICDTGTSYILTKKAYYISNSVLCDFI